MKIYLNPENKWCIIIEDENNSKKKHFIAIPPTNGNRIDVISYDQIHLGYNYKLNGIIIIIINGEPSLINSIF
jgi:hypothetical protein